MCVRTGIICEMVLLGSDGQEILSRTYESKYNEFLTRVERNGRKTNKSTERQILPPIMSECDV